jgi:hemerythrin-like domain-containing protein
MIQINQKLPDFSKPIDLLLACHDNIRNFSYILVFSDNEMQLKKARNYFDTSFSYHHQDESEDIFPLIAAKHPETKTTIKNLEEQHELLNKLLAQYKTQPENNTAKKLYNLYIVHLELEEKEVFPLARGLDANALQNIENKMKWRRNAIQIQGGIRS